MDRLRETRARFFELAVRDVVKKTRKRGNVPGSNSRFASGDDTGEASSKSLEQKES